MKLGELVSGFAINVIGSHGIIVKVSVSKSGLETYTVLWSNGSMLTHKPGQIIPTFITVP